MTNEWAKYEDRRDKWLSELTDEQKNCAIRVMLDELVVQDTVRFHHECCAPYWGSCGEPVVDGQESFSDDEYNY